MDIFYHFSTMHKAQGKQMPKVNNVKKNHAIFTPIKPKSPPSK